MEFFYLPDGQNIYDIGWEIYEQVEFVFRDIQSGIKSWDEVIAVKLPLPIDIPVFLANVGDAKYINYFTSPRGTFLPDFISAFLQIFGHYNLPEDSIKLTTLQTVLIRLAGIYERIITLYYYFAYFLIFNPYEFPWIFITALTEEYLGLLQGYLPVVAGVDLGSAIMVGLVVETIYYLQKLVFTMPYLPSEKTFVNLAPFFGAYDEDPPLDNIIAFHGMPKLWQLLGIPNEVREKWYNEEPWITAHFLDQFGNTDIEILPDRIANGLTEGSITLENSSTLIINVLNLDNLSESTLLTLNHVFDTNIVTNHLITIFERFIQ